MNCPLEMDNLCMSLSEFEKDYISETNEKQIPIDMGIEEQLFKSKYTGPRAINTEEYMNLLEKAREPVEDSRLLLKTIGHQHVIKIDILGRLYEFRPVVCPLTE